MTFKEKYNDWKKKRTYKKIMKRYRNPNVNRAKYLYLYVIFGAIGGLLYIISCLFTGLPWIWGLSPLVILLLWILLYFIKKNWKMFWVFIRNIERGRLLLALNETTEWSYEHKMKVLRWIYLPKRTIRNERLLKLGEKVRTGQKLSKAEKREIKCRAVSCPQQILDGVNKLFLVNALIYAHRNIQVIDDELRDILELSDENMRKFNLQSEINKCKTKESKAEIDKLTRIGKKKAKQNDRN
ncbi:hypothetical protein KAR91_73235 [Candidatus Pacearchaeota archaeon]|nr:hypothetical protein [Candidatus Pacearchaeota archaeon]